MAKTTDTRYFGDPKGAKARRKLYGEIERLEGRLRLGMDIGGALRLQHLTCLLRVQALSAVHIVGLIQFALRLRDQVLCLGHDFVGRVA